MAHPESLLVERHVISWSHSQWYLRNFSFHSLTCVARLHIQHLARSILFSRSTNLGNSLQPDSAAWVGWLRCDRAFPQSHNSRANGAYARLCHLDPNPCSLVSTIRRR